jgi:uncharacterized protein (DUF302 family)
MFKTTFALSALIIGFGMLAAVHSRSVAERGVPAPDGIVKVRSAYSFNETISRLQADVAQKKIVFFMAIDQAKLAKEAGVELRPSTLLVFGNPPLGAQLIGSNPAAGLDWPVRLLVIEDKDGQVWAIYTDFGWIARRHRIADREPQFKMASEVIASITSSIAAR